MKKKILWFGLLILCFAGFLYIKDNLPIASVATSEAQFFEDDFLPLGVAIFMEAFVSIHMSVFVLFPIAGIINQRMKTKIFGVLFLIRLVILIIGDMINPGVMAIVDFMSVFFGAFIVVPILTALKLTVFRNMTSYHEYEEIDYNKLSKIGFSDDELLDNALVQQYVDVKNAICNFDYNKLLELCSSHQYLLYKNEMKLLEKVNERNVIKDFEIKDAKIYDAYKDAKRVEVFIVIKASCIEYSVNSQNKVVRGKQNDKKNIMVEISFINSLGGNMVEECPNCAAPVRDGNVEYCGYCGTSLNYKIGEWVLSREHRVYER